MPQFTPDALGQFLRSLNVEFKTIAKVETTTGLWNAAGTSVGIFGPNCWMTRSAPTDVRERPFRSVGFIMGLKLRLAKL